MNEISTHGAKHVARSAPDKSAPVLSIVVPILNEEEAIAPFLSAVRPCLAQALALVDGDSGGAGTGAAEIIFVDDGSRDGSYAKLRALATESSDIRIIKLSRNFGKDAALTAGLRYATGQAVIPMDVDLQDPPQVIIDMVKHWLGGAHIVNARRANRDGDVILKRQSAQAFYRLYNRLSERPIPYDVGDFRLLDRRVVDAVMTMQETVRFNKGLFTWVGFESETVEFARPARVAGGKSRFHLSMMWRHALDGLTISTTLPLRIWSSIGFLLALGALTYGVVLIIMRWMGLVTEPGYASLMVAILFFSGLNLLSLGIMGEYIGRIASEVRRRPLYIIDEVTGF